MISRRSVRFYIATSFALAVLVVMGGTSLFWFTRQEQTAERALSEQLRERARLLATASDVDQAVAGKFSLPTFTSAFDNNLQIIFVTPDLTVHNLSDYPLAADQQTVVLDLAQDALTGATASREVHAPMPVSEWLYAAAPAYDEDGTMKGAVCLVLSLEGFEAELTHTRTILIVFTGGMTLLSLLLGVLLAAPLSRRLGEAQRLAARVANGDYSLRLPPSGPRELAELAGHLNQMAEELQQQTHERQLLLAKVTHELARPLGALRLGVETLQAGALKDADLTEDLLEEMLRSIGRMESLTEDMSLAARPVAYPVALNLECVDVALVLKDIVARFKPRAVARGIDLSLRLPDDLPTITADERRLHQIMANLIDNALKFTPSGGRVEMSAAKIPEGIQVCVQDTGPGIPDDEIPQVFQPFTQGHHNSELQQGMGLGLSIALQLAVAHNARLELTNMAEGLRATLTFPSAADTPDAARVS
jgi:signal transduction histidine kinase